MGRIAIIFGVLLCALGGGFFVYTGSSHPTALIPAGFGVVLILLGLLASIDKLRMHVMHLAALVGLTGAVVPVVMVTRKLAGGGSLDNAAIEQLIMAALSVVFVALCVKSFIDARRRRKQAEQVR